MFVYLFFQARESAALRETLQAERQASATELQALRAAAHKLEAKIKEMPQSPPVVSEKELEERRRAEEKAAKEILRLTEVGLCADCKPCLLVKPFLCIRHLYPAVGLWMDFEPLCCLAP